MNRRSFAPLAARFGGLLLAAVALAATAAAQERPCTVDHLAGEWAFFTGVGRQALVPAEGDVTSLGTFKASKDGTASGRFDVTFEGFMHVPDTDFTGTIELGADCRGALTFVTSTGSMRTDSIVVVSSDEIVGMSRDVKNLWTYTMRRIDRGPSAASLNAKIDAIMKRLGLAPAGFEAK